MKAVSGTCVKETFHFKDQKCGLQKPVAQLLSLQHEAQVEIRNL